MLRRLIDGIAKRVLQIHTIMDLEGSLSARLKGCYFEFYEMLYTIKKMNIDLMTIIDVGANRGMFSKTANLLFPQSQIVAFEPLKECYEELINLQKSISNLKCFNLALSNTTGEAEIFHSKYDYSSSLLEMGPIHKDAYPTSAEYFKEKVILNKLDNVFDVEKYKRPILLKIDVQGYEGMVIEGARKTVENIDIILVEMSFVPLYSQQILFSDLYKLITECGFEFRGPISINRHPLSRQTLQIDGLFVRK